MVNTAGQDKKSPLRERRILLVMKRVRCCVTKESFTNEVSEALDEEAMSNIVIWDKMKQ